MRRLIVNADDFGFTAGVNRAIVEAHTHGIVTSATLMATGSAFDDAVSRARRAPRLSVGCHVVLVDGRPVLDAAQLSSIASASASSVPADSGHPRFRHGLKSFAARALTGRLNPAEIEAETSAQIRKLQSAGVAVSHIDSHKHTHLVPGVFRAVVKLAGEFGIPWVRLPLDTTVRLGRLSVAFGNHYYRRFAAGKNVKLTDHFLGYRLTGSLTEATFAQALRTIQDGTTEFMCHPGYLGDELKRARTRLKESRAKELAALISPRIRQIISERAIELGPC